MENSEIPGRIQMERFVPVEIFPKKKVIPLEELASSSLRKHPFLLALPHLQSQKKAPWRRGWILVNLYFYTPREPNNYIKRASALFSSFSVVRPTQFFGIIKQQRKEKEKETTRFNLFDLNNSFDLKDEHYNNISRHKRFGGVSFLL